MQKQLQQFLKWCIISWPWLLHILAVAQLHLMQSSAFLAIVFFLQFLQHLHQWFYACVALHELFLQLEKKEKIKSSKTTEQYPNTGSLNDLHPTCSGWKAVDFEDTKLYWALISVLHVEYSQNWHPNQACATRRQMNVWQHSPFRDVWKYSRRQSCWDLFTINPIFPNSCFYTARDLLWQYEDRLFHH